MIRIKKRVGKKDTFCLLSPYKQVKSEGDKREFQKFSDINQSTENTLTVHTINQVILHMKLGVLTFSVRSKIRM